MFELICEVTEVDADWTSDKVAREPDVRPAPVSVRVAADQTYVAREPKVESEREPYDQIVAGSEVIMLPIEVEAFPTCVFVLVLTDDVIPEVWVLVLVLMFAARDEDAFNIWVLVLVFIPAV